MFDFEVRRLSEMTQMLGRRVERLETQDRPAAGTAGGGGTASFNDAAGDPADVSTAASDGVSAWAARLDHVHTFPRSLMFSDAAGNPGTVGTAAVSDGTLTWAARLDHVHAFTFDKTLMFNDGAGNPADVGTVAADGVSVWAARADHVHAYTGGGGGSASFNDAEGDPVSVGTLVAADGTSTFAARRDHQHALRGTLNPQTVQAGAGTTLQMGGGGSIDMILSGGYVLAGDFRPFGGTAGTISVSGLGGTAGLRASDSLVQIIDNTGTAGMRAQGGTVSLIDSAAQELLQVVGGVVRVTPATGGTANLFVGDSTLTTGDARIEIGRDRTDEGLAYIDLIGGTVNTNYGARLLRNGEGVTQFAHQGTAALEFRTVGAAPWEVYTSNTLRFSVNSTGLLSGGSARLTETLTFNETSGTPVTPGTANQIHMYMRNDRIVFMFRDGTTTRWKSLLMTGTGVTWVAGTVAP